MFEPRMMNVANVHARDAFLAALASRRNEFHRYRSRRVRNTILGRLGLLRANRLVTR